MPEPPSVVQDPCPRTRPRPRTYIVIDDDDDDGKSGCSHAGLPLEARSVVAAGGLRAKAECFVGSGRGPEGSGAGGRAAVAASAPPPQNPLTPSSRTVPRARKPPEVIDLDDDEEEEDVRREIKRFVKAEPLDVLGCDAEDLRAGGRASAAASAPGVSKKTRKRRRESSGGAKAYREGGRAMGLIAEPGCSGKARNHRVVGGSPSSSAFVSSEESSGAPSKVRRGGGRSGRCQNGRGCHDAAPVKQVGAMVASRTRSRSGEQRRVLSAEYAAHVVSDDDDDDEAEEDSSDNNGEAQRSEEEEDVMKGKNEGINADKDNRCKSVEEEEGEKELGENENGIHRYNDDTSDEEDESDKASSDEDSGEAGEEQHRTPSSNAKAGGRNARPGEGSPIYGKRMFEGLCLLGKVDNTSAGQGLRKRTRSNFEDRKCLDKKLLKRGTFSKPYRIDAPESSSESEDVPPPVQSQKLLPSHSTCEDDSSGDDSDHGTAKKRRRCREVIADSDSDDSDEDIDNDCEEDRKFAGNARKGSISRRPKNCTSYRQAVKEGCKNYDGSNPRRAKSYVANAGTPTDRCNEQNHISFSKNALFTETGKRGQVPADQDTYDNLINSMFDEIESHKKGSLPAQAQSDDRLPLVFSFGDEDQVEEKSERDEFEDEVWGEFDFALESNYFCSQGWEEGEKSNGQEIPMDKTTSCNQGKHDLVTDDQIGVWCKHCKFIDLEIRHVVAPMVKLSTEREPIDRMLDSSINDILTSMGYEGTCSTVDHKTGLVWGLVPGVWEDMFPHQREAFEFIWQKLAGGIDIEQVKNAVNTDTLSGCVISHAPGTGKTRLAITFLQSYLEVFPRCSPVIIAPRGMLATWEQEFRKWNVKVPFHVLNSTDIHWNEDKTIQRLAADDEDFARRLSMNSFDKKSRHALKLRSWYEGNSIIGLSYSLFRELAREGGKDKHKLRNPARDEGKDEDKMRKLLLQRPDMLVLDEGHTPRNKGSIIWKVLAEVRTKKRIILSGTPFQNNFEELYNILYLLRATRGDVNSELLGKDECKGFWTSLTLNNITDERVNEIRQKLDPFVHIHNGDILQKSLPGLRESVVILNPLPHQKVIIAMMENSEKNGSFDLEYKISLASVHPSLITSMETLSDEVASVVDKPLLERLRWNPCEGVKARFVFEIVRLCEALKERVLVFSQYLEPLELIMEQLSRTFNWTRGKEILLMSGNVRVENRQALMEAFNDMKSEAKVMLASTKACGEGITLIGASRVVLLDVVWNPSVGRQAIGRAYRIGQKKIVYTYNLIAEGTKEKDKYDTQAKKDHMSKLLFSNESQPVGCKRSPEFIFDDRILEAMTEHKKLKQMFVNILPSH